MGEAKKILTQIDHRSFQHPLDRAATASLEKVPGIDWLIRKVLMALGEKRLHLFFLASAVRVNEKQFPDVYKLYLEACEILDMDEPPELFVSQNPMVNAAAIGVDKPFIVINSSLIGLMTEEELRCVMAHELGHVLCGHALYTTVLMFLIRLWHIFVGIPGGILALFAIRAALMEWSRKAELSADRAGLLVVQDPEVAMRVDMKLAGGKAASEMSLEGFLEQAAEYEAGGDVIDGVMKLSLLLDATHPFPVLRVAELKKWAESGEYEKILNGEYIRRGDVEETSFIDNIKKTMGEYKENFDNTDDSFLSAIRDLSGGVASVSEDIFSVFTGKKSKKSDDAE